ncbi:sperm acrosome-associated protein 7-like [Mesocricetus auratus]|uniref:Sperm acrosome-associated protein 7-like n=1 Tax=Mesocricetus auratus TaxID=10036 RepID=A0A3Q0CWV3_MESAU|nr:sperm acrosome-associated protein 7-like [Mesocricetus auratus]
MAANRGVGTFVSVFLLCCWQDVQPWPNREFSGSSSEQLPSLKNMDDDIATVFDEILVREILEPGKASYFEGQSPSTTSEPKTTKEKKAHRKDFSAPKRHEEKQLPPGTLDAMSFDDEERETLFQMKSLDALEKIIDTIRRAIGTHLKKKRKFQKSRRIRQLLGKLT